MKKFSLFGLMTLVSLLAGNALCALPANVGTSITTLGTDITDMVALVVTAILGVVAAGLAIYAIRLVLRKGKGGLNSAS